jgi:uncharacterized membrane-anchored protein
MIRPLIAALTLSLAAAGKEGAEKIEWTRGPAKGELGEAYLKIPKGYLFTGREGTQRAMKLTGNLVTNQEAGMIMPELAKEDKDKEQWFVVFEYDPMGHVNDDERDSIDADALLKARIEGNKSANEQKAKQGFPTLDVLGWAVPPHYDTATHNLEWALKLHSKQGERDLHDVVNYEVRLLGREGVMKSTLVISPEGLDDVLPAFRAILKDFEFNPGRKYSEYRKGDRLATIGLTALIGGGAVAVAAKSGLLKYLWKLIVVGVAAVAAFLRRLFGSRKASQVPPAS